MQLKKIVLLVYCCNLVIVLRDKRSTGPPVDCRPLSLRLGISQHLITSSPSYRWMLLWRALVIPGHPVRRGRGMLSPHSFYSSWRHRCPGPDASPARALHFLWPVSVSCKENPLSGIWRQVDLYEAFRLSATSPLSNSRYVVFHSTKEKEAFGSIVPNIAERIMAWFCYIFCSQQDPKCHRHTGILVPSPIITLIIFKLNKQAILSVTYIMGAVHSYLLYITRLSCEFFF